MPFSLQILISEVSKGGAAHLAGTAAEHTVVIGVIRHFQQTLAIDGQGDLIAVAADFHLIGFTQFPVKAAFGQGGVAKIVFQDHGVSIGAKACGVAPLGGLGGGPDVAEEADVSIVVLPIVRGRTPSIVNRVFTCCTPGQCVACVVTQAGIALNPSHRNYEMLKQDLASAGIQTVSIESLRDLALSITGTPKPIETTEEVVAIVEARDGTVMDVIRRIR